MVFDASGRVHDRLQHRHAGEHCVIEGAAPPGGDQDFDSRQVGHVVEVLGDDMRIDVDETGQAVDRGAREEGVPVRAAHREQGTRAGRIG